MGKVFLAWIILCFAALSGAQAGEADPVFRSTTYPLPRFVSLGSDEIHVRTGPGRRYPILWVFKAERLPVEIILEYDTWRKIRDHEDQEGWIHSSLLSGKRTALVRAAEPVSLYRKPDSGQRIVALAEPGAIVNLEQCRAAWCKIEAAGYRGWLQKEFLWGVYGDEIVE